MAEPLIFRINNETQWDGVTPVAIKRDDFEKDGRWYSASTPDGGAIEGDFFGLLSKTAPKIVSIACNSLDPRVIAKVTPPVFPARSRFVLDLTPTYQSVLMAGDDVLRITSQGPESGTRELTIIVNEISEQEAVRLATRLGAETRMVRHRIVRNDGQGFSLATNGPLLTSDFDYSLSIDYLTATVSGQGYVSIKDLVDPGSGGAYVWVRFTGIGNGDAELYLIDPRTDEVRSIQAGLKSPLWSEPVWLAREDRLGFRTPAPPAGLEAAIEFEVSTTRQRRV